MAPSSVIKYVKLVKEGTTVCSYEYETKGGSNGRNLGSNESKHDQLDATDSGLFNQL
jgi:hypothetical protein